MFIRAPLVESVGEDVEVLADWEGSPVAVRQGSVVATSFHPELIEDSRLHELALFDDQPAATDTPADADTPEVSQ